MELCEHQVLDNGIHKFTINEDSNAAIDALYLHVRRVTDAAGPDDPPNRYLIVKRGNIALPLTYLRSRAKELDRQRSTDRPPSRVAILYDGLLATVASSILQLVTKNQIIFFKTHEYNEAVAWLLKTE